MPFLVTIIKYSRQRDGNLTLQKFFIRDIHKCIM